MAEVTREEMPRDWHGRIMAIGSLSERFWAKVKKSDGCWLWTGPIMNSGYGRGPGRNSKYTIAHRLSWELRHGEIPSGLLVLHRCDNRLCVNPEHLFLGTYKDNTADMWAKGRAKGPAAERAAATHCQRGHAFDDANTRIYKNYRVCLACKRAGAAAWEKANRNGKRKRTRKTST